MGADDTHIRRFNYITHTTLNLMGYRFDGNVASRRGREKLRFVRKERTIVMMISQIHA